MKKILIIVLTILLTACSNSNSESVKTSGKGTFQSSPSTTVKELFPAVVMEKDGEKWGYINKDGTFEIKPQYSVAGEFNTDGIAIVADVPAGKSRYEALPVSFIDSAGKTISGPYNSPLPQFLEDYAIINESGKGGKLINKSGKVVFESSYYLSSIKEGMICFSDKTGDKTAYGFLDLKGNVVIPAQYRYASGFIDGKAAVSLSDGSYALIAKDGSVLQTSPNYIGQWKSSEGLTAFKDDKLQSFGYKSADGGIAIAPQFETAGEFKEGFAVVGVSMEKQPPKQGLINRSGEFILKAEYSGIHYIGYGLYSVSKDGFSPNFDYYVPKAIFNNRGQKLTDFIYFGVGSFEGEYAWASDEKTTFFIDRSGKIVENLPKINGIGKLELRGDIIKAELDKGLAYLKSNGEKIWEKTDIVILEDGSKIKRMKYRPNFTTLVVYPEITGHPDKGVQDNMNAKLKELFTKGVDNVRMAESGNSESIEIDFKATRNKDLLTIENSGYTYPAGAAHGMPTRFNYHIDYRTGELYSLASLFRSGSDYQAKLASIVTKQIELNKRMILDNNRFIYFEDKPKVRENHDFIVGKDALKIYFTPYEIAAYAAGFPEFEIPYGQLDDIINREGAFWNAFEKEIKNGKTFIIGDVREDALKAVNSVMKEYESQMIEAINTNDFTKVQQYLIPDSSLYESQKKLVQSLVSQGIKERLEKYDIYAIAFESQKKEYRVFVSETVSIKYPAKDYQSMDFAWCYTVRQDTDNLYKLRGIEKW